MGNAKRNKAASEKRKAALGSSLYLQRQSPAEADPAKVQEALANLWGRTYPVRRGDGSIVNVTIPPSACRACGGRGCERCKNSDGYEPTAYPKCGSCGAEIHDGKSCPYKSRNARRG